MSSSVWVGRSTENVPENWHISGAGFRWMARLYRIVKPTKCPAGRDWIRRNASKFRKLKKIMYDVFAYRTTREHRLRQFVTRAVCGKHWVEFRHNYFDTNNADIFLRKRDMLAKNRIWLYPYKIECSLFVLHSSHAMKYFIHRAPLGLSWSEYRDIYLKAVKTVLETRDCMYLASAHGVAYWVQYRENYRLNTQSYDDIPF